LKQFSRWSEANALVGLRLHQRPKSIRAKTKFNQPKFADKLRITVGVVRDWKQHRLSPHARARTRLRMFDSDPKAALELIERMS